MIPALLSPAGAAQAHVTHSAAGTLRGAEHPQPDPVEQAGSSDTKGQHMQAPRRKELCPVQSRTEECAATGRQLRQTMSTGFKVELETFTTVNNTGSHITQGKKPGVMSPPAPGHELVASRAKGGICPPIHSVAQAAGCNPQEFRHP